MPEANLSTRRPPALGLELERVEVTGVEYLSITSRNLKRSVDFYERVFGFHVVEQAHEPSGSCVLTNARGVVYLAIHTARDAMLDCAQRRTKWSFAVSDLDRARAAVWSLGVPTADGSDEPRRTRRWRSGRSFVVNDPDGHEIELVERQGEAFGEHA